MASKSGRFWGAALGLSSAWAGITAGVIKGSYDAATGKGRFVDSYNKTANQVIDKAIEIGEEHGETLTKAAIAVTTQVVGGAVSDHVNHRHGPNGSV